MDRPRDRDANPLLHYDLLRANRRQGRWGRWILRLGGVGLWLAMFVFSVWAYLDTPGIDRSITGDALFAMLYFPLLLTQFFGGSAPLLLANAVIAHEEARGTWEAIKITGDGAALMLRARWAAIFVRLRGLVIIVLGLRALMVIRLWADLLGPDFDLDAALDGVTPAVSPAGAVILLVLLSVGALLLPLAEMGLNAALGLAVAAFVRDRFANRLAVAGLLLARGMVFSGAIVFGLLASETEYALFTEPVRWLGMVALIGGGDQGLLLLDLGLFADLWDDLKYAILLAAVVPGLVVVQAVMMQSFKTWAMLRASRPGRR